MLHARLRRPGVGFTPQSTALYPTLSIESTMNFFGRLLELDLEDIKERTDDLLRFLDLPPKTRKIHTLSGNVAKNKGMALFPRKVNGRYVMLLRQDGVNNYIAFSDRLRSWNEAKRLQEPEHPLEFLQIGNCGSPVETPEGWLALFLAPGTVDV